MTQSNPSHSDNSPGHNARAADRINVHDVIGRGGASGSSHAADRHNGPVSSAAQSRDFAAESGETAGPGVLLDGPNVSTLNVLLVGNDAFCKRVTKRLAEAHLVAKTSCVPDYLMALGQASHVAPDVVLGQVDGLLGRARALSTGLRRLAPGVQLLVVAEPQKASLAIKAVESGFDDYLIEPVEASALRSILLPESTTKQRSDFGASTGDQPPAKTAAAQKQQSSHQSSQKPSHNVLASTTVMENNWSDAWAANVAGMSTAQIEAAKKQPAAQASGSDEPSSLSSHHPESEPKQTSAAPAGPSPRAAQSNRAQQTGWSGSSGNAGEMYGDDPYDTSDAELGDIDLVDCLLTEPARFKQTVLKLVGGRSGVANIDFSENATDVPQDHAGAWVTFRGRRLGVLHAPAPAVKLQLAPWASWLAHWMAMQQQMTSLWNMANKDELTGAWNRRFFDRHLARVIALAAQKRLPVTVLVFDIDNFKTYNDRYGHPAGDEILCETVRLMGSVIREHDVVARIGGDEFAVVFWDPHGPRKPDSTHPDDVRNAARRFQQAICSHHFPKLLEEAPGTLTISGGLASYPWDGVTAQSLVERADTMLLHSKTQGKNAITFGAGAARGGDPFEHES